MASVAGCPLPRPQARDSGAALQELLQGTATACSHLVTRSAFKPNCMLTKPPLILALECNKLAYPIYYLLFCINDGSILQ